MKLHVKILVFWNKSVAQRINVGPLPVDEALAYIAREVQFYENQDAHYTCIASFWPER